MQMQIINYICMIRLIIEESDKKANIINIDNSLNSLFCLIPK